MLVQITTPKGAVYVQPHGVAMIGPAIGPEAKTARVVTLIGGGQFTMLDEPSNMEKLGVER